MFVLLADVSALLQEAAVPTQERRIPALLLSRLWSMLLTVCNSVLTTASASTLHR
jgi:hypothetical protein